MLLLFFCPGAITLEFRVVVGRLMIEAVHVISVQVRLGHHGD